MNCQGCYNECRPGAKFCSRCGHRFGTSVSASEFTPPPAASPFEVEIPAHQANPYAIEKYGSEGSYQMDQLQVEDLRKKAKKIVVLFASVAAGLTLLWLPFIDLVFLLPLLCYMVITISNIFGQKFTFAMAKELIMTCIAGTLTFLGSYACGKFIPVVGGILTAPLIYGCTYGIGDVAIAYFSQEGKLSRAQMREIYNRGFQNSKKYYSGDLDEAKQSLRNIKDYISPEEYERIKKRLG